MAIFFKLPNSPVEKNEKHLSILSNIYEQQFYVFFDSEGKSLVERRQPLNSTIRTKLAEVGDKAIFFFLLI